MRAATCGGSAGAPPMAAGALTTVSLAAETLRALLNEVDREGWEVAAFYHSHPDHAAYFSEEDTERALFHGEPLHPDTAYIILGLDAAEVRELKAFRWDAAKKAFVESP